MKKGVVKIVEAKEKFPGKVPAVVYAALLEHKTMAENFDWAAWLYNPILGSRFLLDSDVNRQNILRRTEYNPSFHKWGYVDGSCVIVLGDSEDYVLTTLDSLLPHVTVQTLDICEERMLMKHLMRPGG